MGLQEYNKKRRFDETPEPEGRPRKRPGSSFVIQKHRASRLHYDLRLEMDGVLRSWAVPKGPSLDPGEKRLAVQTEDHPVDYGSFEGVIPKGNYGAGKVIIWDHGTYEMVDPSTAQDGWKKRKFHFVLHGKKLGGEWVLVETRRGERQWIFFKVRDDYADAADITELRPESVVSGLLVEQVGEKGAQARHWYVELERELEKRGMKKGRRMAPPREVSPMLATLREEAFDGEEWLFEMKLDGIRAIVSKDGADVHVHSRNKKLIGRRFPTLVRALAALPVDQAVIDGEIVVFDEAGRSRFNLIQPRINLTGESDIEKADTAIPAYLYAFDLLHINGYSLVACPLVDRKAILRKLITDDRGWIRYTDHVERRGREFFEVASAHDLEGMVAKRKDSTYRQGRSRQWLKIKTTRSEEFVVVGFTPPGASRKHFGALVLGQYDSRGRLVYVGRAGAGFDDAGLAQAHANLERLVRKKAPFSAVPAELSEATWVSPQLVAEVKFNEWTPDAKLRAPVFLRFRDDIEPSTCINREDPEPDPIPAHEQPPEAGRPEPGPGASFGTRVQLTNMTRCSGRTTGLPRATSSVSMTRSPAFSSPISRTDRLSSRDILTASTASTSTRRTRPTTRPNGSVPGRSRARTSKKTHATSSVPTGRCSFIWPTWPPSHRTPGVPGWVGWTTPIT